MSAFIRIRKTLWRTLLQAVPTALGIVVLFFLLLQLVPGNAAGFQRPNNRRKFSL